jgi:purine-binding chemotaxis protein CheW
MSARDGYGFAAFDLDRVEDEAPEEVRRCILFQACDEWFGMPIEWVREIQPLDRITRVPNASAEIPGIMNLRGRVLTLFELAGCLRIPPGTQPNTHVLVLDFADPELNVGVLAQRIAQVREIPVSAVEPPPLREGGAGGLEGIFELEGQVVGLLDLARVFGRFLADWGVALEARGAA